MAETVFMLAGEFDVDIMRVMMRCLGDVQGVV
jgi:hypothetical protein